MGKYINYIEGDIIGECIFIKDVDQYKHIQSCGKSKYIRIAEFKCKCGNLFRGNIEYIKSLKTKSCGCLVQNNYKDCKKYLPVRIKHGFSKRRNIASEYNIWKGMKSRCNGTSFRNKKEYKNRGITVCDRWIDQEEGFINFYKDMGKRPSSKHSIDRIDNNLGYFPENCRWATVLEQNTNKSNNFLITYKNITKTLSEWSKITNIPRNTLEYRVLNWSNLEKCFNYLTI